MTPGKPSDGPPGDESLPDCNRKRIKVQKCCQKGCGFKWKSEEQQRRTSKDSISSCTRSTWSITTAAPTSLKRAGWKYTDEQLLALLADDTRPVFAAVDEAGHVLGYAFCILQQHPGDNILTDIQDPLYRRPLRRREYPRAAYRAAALRVRQTVRQRDRLLQPDLNVWGLQRERQKVL